MRQRYWAVRHGVPFDNQGYVVELNDNLFMPLSPGAIQNFNAGAGGELNDNMYALHSSSALVVNVFDYWRLYGLFGPIFSTICPHLANRVVGDIQFEFPAPIWQGGHTHPHLDVMFWFHDRATPDAKKVVAVESKFREPYGQAQGNFADVYLHPDNVGIWEGLAPLHDVAVQIHAGQILFHRLRVAQLIKHVLGLRAEFGIPNVELLYLWYAAPGMEAVQHANEIRRFAQLAMECRPRLSFRALTYQKLIDSLVLQRKVYCTVPESMLA